MAQTRRNLAGSVALLAALGAAGLAGGVERKPDYKMTSIMAAAARLKVLCALDESTMTDDEADAVTREQCDLSKFIGDGQPSTIPDVIAMLVWAAAEIQGNDLHTETGTYGFERGDVVVRRVIHFLAEQQGVSLDDCGGPFLLPHAEQEARALPGTMLEAAVAFNDVDARTKSKRVEEYNHLVARDIILQRTGHRITVEREA